MSSCRSCGAEIIWARTERGKRMPLDAMAIDAEHIDSWRGLFVLRDRSSSEGPLAIAAWGLDPRNDPHYVSHFSSCPNADSHRRQS